MESIQKPLWLFADSSPLFHGPRGRTWFADECATRGYDVSRAFYAGHANDHDPAHFEIFTAAMTPLVPAQACRQLVANEDWWQDWRENDLLLLAGGDPRKLAGPASRKGLIRARKAGVLILGISAGAMFMGRRWQVAFGEGSTQNGAPEPAEDPWLGWLPYYVDAHQEDTDWQRLRLAEPMPPVRGRLGIPWRSVVLWEDAAGLVPLQGAKPWVST